MEGVLESDLNEAASLVARLTIADYLRAPDLFPSLLPSLLFSLSLFLLSFSPRRDPVQLSIHGQ